jgi:DHA2 family multidrug resistance protein
MATTTLSAPMSAPRTISPWLLAATVPLASFMEFLDTTIVNVAVEHIAGDLSATIDESTYVLTSYLVANVIVLPLSGYLSGLLGRKNYYLWSVAIFTIASLLCGFAPSLYWLVFFRVLQGLGGGGLQPVSQAIIMDAFPAEKRSTAQAVFSITAVIAPAIGPLLGGWITDNYSWRWIFFINIPIGVLAFILNSRFIQDPSYLARFSFRERKFDYQGLGFLAVGLGSLQFVLDRGQIDDWFGSQAITTFSVLSFCCLSAFVWWELHHESPVVDLRVLKNLNFSLCILMMFVTGAVFYAVTYLIPLFAQEMLGWTATTAGLCLSPSALVFIAMMPIMPWLIRRITPRYMIFVGFTVHGLSCILMAGWDLQIPYWLVLASRTLEICGLAWLLVPINVMAFGFLSKEKVTSGSGLLSLSRNFGASCGISLAATLLARRSQFHQNVLIQHLTPGDETYRASLQRGAEVLFHHGSSLADAATTSFALFGRQLIEQASLLSYIDVFWLLTYLSRAVAPIALFIRKLKAPPPPEAFHAE